MCVQCLNAGLLCLIHCNCCIAHANPLSDLVSVACWGQLIQRKLQEILKKLFLISTTAPVVVLIPNHALPLGLCCDTFLLHWVLNLADLARTSQTTLQGKTLPSWQPRLKGQFYGGGGFLLPKVTPLEVFFVYPSPNREISRT